MAHQIPSVVQTLPPSDAGCLEAGQVPITKAPATRGGLGNTKKRMRTRRKQAQVKPRDGELIRGPSRRADAQILVSSSPLLKLPHSPFRRQRGRGVTF
jgi:hypothetical protein